MGRGERGAISPKEGVKLRLFFFFKYVLARYISRYGMIRNDGFYSLLHSRF